MKRFGGLGVALLLGCAPASVQERVATGNLRGACDSARENGSEGATSLARALDQSTDFAWKIEPATPEDMFRAARVPASFDEYVPMYVTFRVKEMPGIRHPVVIHPPRLSVNGASIDLGWGDPRSRELPPAVRSIFVPPQVSDEVEVPPLYHPRVYEWTRRPRVSRRGSSGGRPGQDLEAAITGFLSALTLGQVRQTGARGRGPFTPASERALYRWYTENGAAREAFDAREYELVQASVRAKREAERFNRERDDEYRAWRRTFREYSVRSMLSPSCQSQAEETATFIFSTARTCHWLVVVPREPEGEVELTFRSETNAYGCRHQTTHSLAGSGEAVATIVELVGETRTLRTMEPVRSEVEFE